MTADKATPRPQYHPDRFRHVPYEATAVPTPPTPDIAALKEAVVEAALKWSNQHTIDRFSRHHWTDEVIELVDASDALRVARTPKPPPDPVEELREAAEKVAKHHGDSTAMRRLRAAIAAMKERGK